MDLPHLAADDAELVDGETVVQLAVAAHSVSSGEGISASLKRRRSTSSGKTDSDSAPAANKLEPLPGCHVALSGLSSTLWTGLTRLDAVAERNKPTAPPTKTASAPFFLPTVSGLQPKFIRANEGSSAVVALPAPFVDEQNKWDSSWPAATTDFADAGEDGGEGDAAMSSEETKSPRINRRGRIIHSRGGRIPHSQLANLLTSNDVDVATCSGVSEYLASLSPAGVDAEIRSLCLGPQDSSGLTLLRRFLLVLQHELQLGRRFDLCQSQLELVLTAHGDTLASSPSLVEAAHAVQSIHADASLRLTSMLDSGLCLVAGILGQ
jgi:U3 small nucleolar RNA-associated protein 21